MALFSVFLVVLDRPLCAQPLTYTSYDFTTLAGTEGVVGSSDGTGPAAQFNGAMGVAVDGSGNVYVADTGNDTIRKVTAGGAVTTLAGTPGSAGSADGTGSAARFRYPMGVAVDGAGNVYVADTGNDTIRKVTAGGAVTTLAGTAGVYGSADGTGSAAQFGDIIGIAVDGSGNVYVADYGESTIRKVTAGGVVTTLSGTARAYGSADGTGSTAQFHGPIGVAVDGVGSVYVADSYNRMIRKVTAGGVVTTLAGMAGVYGSADGTGSAARFSDTLGVAVDGAGNVYVADGNTIRKVTAGGVVTTLAGIPGLDGSANGIGPAAQFLPQGGVAADAGGRVYASDSYVIRIGSPAAQQAPATVTLGNLYQTNDGIAKVASVATNPAGLATLVVYSSQVASAALTPPSDTGSYSVFATVIDPNYTGSAYGTLTIGPPLYAQPSFTIRSTRAGGNFLWGIAAGSAGLVAVGDGGTILTSPDGAAWTRRASGTANWLTSVTYGGGQYVAVGDNGCVLLSTDGATWSSVAQSATTARLNNVLYAAGKYVAVGEGGSIINSTDGRDWTARISGVPGWLRGLAYTRELDEALLDDIHGTLPARFVAAGQGGAIITSSDGAMWQPDLDVLGSSRAIGQAPSVDLEGLVAAKSTSLAAVYSSFVALGADGTLFTDAMTLENTVGPFYLINSDGQLAFPGIHFRGLVRAPGALIASGENGTIVSAPSDQGPWSQVASGTTADLVGGVAIGDSIYLIGENETILQSAPPPASRLANLSCRAQVGTGANILITGFVSGGQGTSGSVPVLIRGSGPALVPFGVPGTLPDPKLELYGTGSGDSLLAANSAWGGAPSISSAAATLGAFPWTDPSSHDAALLETLHSGPYTANISGTSGDTGVALAEVYDATADGAVTSASPRLVNLSARSLVGTGGNSLIAGFVVAGSTPKTVLIRASGPALAPFGVSGTLPDPKLQVFNTESSSVLAASNTGWGGDAQTATAAAWVGAFSWGSSATPDSALLLTLSPGPYTANVTGASGDTGIALIEVYEVQ